MPIEQFLLDDGVFDDKRNMSVRMGELSISVLISVSFFASFLTFYFFIITAKVEAKVVTDNIKRVTDEMFGNIKGLIDPMTREMLHASLQQIQSPDMSEQDKRVSDINRQITVEAVQIVLMLVLTCALILLIIWIVMRVIAGEHGKAHVDYPDIWRIIKDNAILLVFVVLAELLFLFGIAAYHRNLNANLVRHDIIEVLRKFINN